MRAGRRRGRLPRQLGLTLLGAATGLTLAEVGARLLLPPPRTHTTPLELHGERGFRGVPGTRLPFSDERGDFAFVLGPEGFRGRELPGAPGAERRVVFLGDSFLMGLGLREEELVPARAERALREQGLAAEVYNLSSIDYGTGQELLLLDRYGERLAPDDVVLVMYPANDIVNDTRELAGRTEVSVGDPVRPYVYPEGAGEGEGGGGPLRREYVHAVRGPLRREYVHTVRGPLRGHSRLFARIEFAFFPPAVPGTPPAQSMTTRLQNGGLPVVDLEIFRRHDPGDAWERGWRRSFSLLRAVRDRCQALGARFLVVVVPLAHQVQRGAKVVAWDVASRQVAGTPLDARIDWNLPERRLERFFAEEEIDARMLLTPLRAAVEDGVRVYSRDGHLTPEGHALAARPVLDWLQGLAPAPPSERAAGPPARLLPAASAAPRMLDFRASAHEDYLGSGWYGWGAEAAEAAGGWWVADRALAVLPDRAGDFFVEGVVPVGAALPNTVRMERVGDAVQHFRLDAPGPFKLRMNRGGDADAPSANGYAVFLLHPDSGAGRQGSALRVQRIGVEPRGTDGEARSLAE